MLHHGEINGVLGGGQELFVAEPVATVEDKAAVPNTTAVDFAQLSQRIQLDHQQMQAADANNDFDEEYSESIAYGYEYKNGKWKIKDYETFEWYEKYDGILEGKIENLYKKKN